MTDRRPTTSDSDEPTLAELRAELETLRSRHRQLERAGFGFVTLDATGAVVEATGQVSERLRIRVGTKLDDALPLTTRRRGRVINLDHPFAVAVRGQAVEAREYYVTLPNSMPHRIALCASPKRAGGAEAWVLSLGDVDELERNALHRAIDAAQFSRLATHDLAEPLRKVYSLLQLVEEDNRGRLVEGSEELIEHASDGARRLQKALSQLLHLSRIVQHDLVRTPTELATLITGFETRHRTQLDDRGATIEVEALPTLEVDPQQLQQVFDALLSNGLRFAGDNPPQLRVSASVQDDTWTIHVDDAGIGIEAKFRDVVFDVFRRLHGRTRGSGAGLGLAIARRVIDLHGGRIWIEDGPPGQTRVSFTLE